jgi:CBS domain-containing protein
MPTVHDVLMAKGSTVHTIRGDVSVLEATQLMNRHQIGALVVTDGDDHVMGMFTERDVLRRIVAEQRNPAGTPVSAVMTRRVVCCHADDDLNRARAIMAERRVRHLPVTDSDERLLGLISIGDLNAWSIQDGEITIAYMKDYIHGRT